MEEDWNGFLNKKGPNRKAVGLEVMGGYRRIEN